VNFHTGGVDDRGSIDTNDPNAMAEQSNQGRRASQGVSDKAPSVAKGTTPRHRTWIVTLRAVDHPDLQSAKDKVISHAANKMARVRYETAEEVSVEVRLADSTTQRNVERMFGLLAGQVKHVDKHAPGDDATMHRRWAVSFGPVTDAAFQQLHQDISTNDMIVWAIVVGYEAPSPGWRHALAPQGPGTAKEPAQRVAEAEGIERGRAIVSLKASRFVTFIATIFDAVPNVTIEAIDKAANLEQQRQQLLLDQPTWSFEIGRAPYRGGKRRRDGMTPSLALAQPPTRARTARATASFASLGGEPAPFAAASPLVPSAPLGGEPTGSAHKEPENDTEPTPAGDDAAKEPPTEAGEPTQTDATDTSDIPPTPIINDNHPVGSSELRIFLRTIATFDVFSDPDGIIDWKTTFLVNSQRDAANKDKFPVPTHVLMQWLRDNNTIDAIQHARRYGDYADIQTIIVQHHHVANLVVLNLCRTFRNLRDTHDILGLQDVVMPQLQRQWNNQ
jgi:hypothetical protein